MSILSKSKIASLITEDVEGFKASLERGEMVEKILISPFEHKNLGPTSYDLTLGGVYIPLGRRLKQKHINAGQRLRIEPGEAVTLATQEYIGLPPNIAGMVFSKVGWLQRGLSQISTYVHPGFYGQLTETITNVSGKRVELEYGTAFCQIIFEEIPDAKSDERYTGKRIAQTGDTLERLMREHNPHFSINGTIDSFLKTGLAGVGVLLGCAIYATQANLWPENLGWSVTLVLAAIFGGFLIEMVRRRLPW